MTPDKYTIKEYFLDVGNSHELYIHDWGNPKVKIPVVFLHGGPGGGCGDKHKLQFDPKKHRVIFFDQRGSGRSLPYGSLKHNTTKELVEDIEKIITHLKFKQVILRGGSWGSTLALAFGIKYPKRVKAMVLQGIWTGSKDENDWITKGGFKTFFPDVWERFVASVPKSHQHDPGAYHLERVTKGSAAAALASAFAYENMERALLELDDRFSPADTPPPEYDPASMRIEMHYTAAAVFLPDNYILTHAAKLTMPIWLVQGRYDMVCPPVTAYRLHQKLPKSYLIMTATGHKSAEREADSVLRAILLSLEEK